MPSRAGITAITWNPCVVPPGSQAVRDLSRISYPGPDQLGGANDAGVR
jgi:hypothetical protein